MIYPKGVKESFKRLTKEQLAQAKEDIDVQAKARIMGASLGLGSINEKEAFALMGVPDLAVSDDGVPLIAEALYENVARSDLVASASALLELKVHPSPHI